MELEEIKKLTEQGEEEYLEYLEKGCRPAFGSPGGKRYLAKTIVGYIPEHKTYVEPFVGGGAVFFAKEPSEVEVINDLDKDIAFAYRFMKKISDEDLKKLKKKNWVGSKSHFENLKKNKPENDLERFYRFSYIMRFSRFKNYVSSFEGQEADCASTLPNIKERLKDVKIENNDYKESINYDSKETFYYLDPPYPDTENKTIGGNISLIELHNFCKKIKGKFMLSLNDGKMANKIFKDFNIKKVKVLQSFSNTEGTQEFRKELLISNFPLKKENIYLAKSDKEYYEGLDKWKQDFIYDFAEMAKNLEGKTILDLGCGTGRVMEALINSDYYNYQVDGIDNNDIALGICKKKGLAVKKLDLEEGKLPHTDNFFCNVIGLHILEHLKEPSKIIKEAIRVAENKVIFISPMGRRLDPTHKREFIKIDDFKALFDKSAEVKMVDHGDNTAIAIIKVAKIKKADNLKPFGTFIPPKPTMAGITESFSVDEIWPWCEKRLLKS
jgi:DNA adenine methylase